jgi:hypothetical protein
MTYKQIEASRETRLWIGQVIVPACAAVTMVLANPNARHFVADKANVVKNFVKDKFTKKKES